jgi:nitrate/nitrite-specific signal transduction histidine kinase
MQRRIFLLSAVGAATGVSLVAPVRAQVASINDAINKAGRQRMLSQRLAKAYLQIGQGIDVERSRRVLDASLALFDRQLVELKAFPPAREIRNVLLDQEKAWAGYKELLVGANPSAEGARKVLAASEEVLVLAHDATVRLEKISASVTGRLVNIAGRQRMLSQRMAKFYQAIGWHVAPPIGPAELETARKEFVTALAELAASPRNTQDIKQDLELVQVQWTFFDSALKNAPSAATKTQVATHVATTSERILEVMDRVTGLYDKLA